MKTSALAASRLPLLPEKRGTCVDSCRQRRPAAAVVSMGPARTRRPVVIRATLSHKTSPEAVERRVVPGAAAALAQEVAGEGFRSYLPVPPEALDDWMNSSITEIVRDVGETPLLVHVYDREPENHPRLDKEKAEAGSWPRIVERWKRGCPVPDGMILIDQLKLNSTAETEPEESTGVDVDRQPMRGKEGSRMWGVLVQGRGLDRAACYILKTDTVKSTAGYCTYFCLARASCFGDDAASQLRNSWLADATLSRFRQHQWL